MLNTNDQQGRIPETTLQCIQHLRRHLPRSRVSVEVEKPGREGLRELASEADVVFYSRSWAEVSRLLARHKTGAVTMQRVTAGTMVGVCCRTILRS